MKIFKKAFSLAELLIALGIISIITVMGISIAKSGTESAYNIYYYTGFKGLYEAITNANVENVPLSGNFLSAEAGSFIDYIIDRDVLDAEKTPSVDGTTCLIHGIFNGVSYNFTYLGDITISGETFEAYTIDMTVPTVKKKVKINSQDYQVVGTTARFLYIPQYNNGILMPIAGAAAQTNSTDKTTTATINLQNRADLLTFYVDNIITGNTGTVGRVGRVNYYYASDPEEGTRTLNLSGFSPRTFLSYKDAYCTLYRTTSTPATLTATVNGQSVTYCDCTGITGTPMHGAIGFENPRNAF